MFRAFELGGSALALLFWWESLAPTLIPRSWVMQGGVGAVCVVIGYGVGAVAGRWQHRLIERWGRSPDDALRRAGRIIIGVAWLVSIPLGARLWLDWQNEQRDLMGLEPLVLLDGVLMSALSMAAGALLVMIGRAIVSLPAIVLLIVVLGTILGRGVVLRALGAVANSIYAPVNERTTEGTVPPVSSSVSGSKASFVSWNTLGRMGRDFVATAATAEELELFHGAGARLADPVRVYVGVDSAASAAERAELAVRELERAGGFDRKVLAVWVPTGTGWMVPQAATALEQLHRGDTAIVAIQYSFLPSLLAVFVDSGLASEAGITLFDAVRARWSQLPPERRPKLVLFGKSLGTAGVEAPFVGADASSSVAGIMARTDGALMAGASRSNPIHAQLTRERDRGSPVWQPVFEGGRSVRFLNRDPHQPVLHEDWLMPRIVYLQHPADPVPLWSVEAIWWPPEWMDHPRGFDMPKQMRWFPIVSSVQSVGDFLNQLGPPPGFGHDYSTEYVRGWARVVPPEDWTDADIERLEKFIEKTAEDEEEP